MTISYSFAIGSANFGKFSRLLLRWKGSIYKLVVKEFLVFAVAYYGILLVRRFALSAEQEVRFHSICAYFRDYLDFIPMTFILGFFVNMILTRWWNIYNTLPWVDRVAVLATTYIRADDERGRMYRRNMMRYLNIAAVLCLRAVSSAVMKRFPTIQHFVDANIMTKEEKRVLESVTPTYGNYFQPVFWFSHLVMDARKDGYLENDLQVKHILEEVNNYRSSMGGLLSYDWISVPLVYTQVVTLVVYTFTFACLIGRQYLEEKDNQYWVSMYFPFFTFLQFFFFMGWLKCAEVMINPLGDDDDDFELNYLIDRNVGIGFLMVDELHANRPTMGRDPLWNDTDPQIPYTTAAAASWVKPFIGSVIEMKVANEEQAWAKDSEVFDRKETLAGLRKRSTRKGSRFYSPRSKSAAVPKIYITGNKRRATTKASGLSEPLVSSVVDEGLRASARSASDSNVSARPPSNQPTSGPRNMKEQFGTPLSNRSLNVHFRGVGEIEEEQDGSPTPIQNKLKVPGKM